MIIDFTKLSPGGNDTIIVATPVPASDRAAIARTLMNSRYTGGEQVGYLTRAPRDGIDGRVDMMGGELCINALRSAATVLALSMRKTNLRLTSSGTDEVFECSSMTQDGRAYISITLNCSPRINKLSDRIFLVNLDGISHLLCEYLPQVRVDPPKVFTEMRVRYAEALQGLPAFGITPFQRCEEGYKIFPVVYVRETDTIIPETACGSGSIALALGMTDDKARYNIIQPSGCLYQVDVSRKVRNVTATLGSNVDILVKGVAFIHLK